MEGLPQNQPDNELEIPLEVQDSQPRLAEENSRIDFAPQLTLKQKNADLSYRYAGEKFLRSMDTYVDQNNTKWIEIKKSPKVQMSVSLLSQPFFNISTIAEVPSEFGKMSKVLARVHPQLSAVFEAGGKILGKESSTYASKVMNTEKFQQKTKPQMLADYHVFQAIFEGGRGDRAFIEGHNIIKKRSTYALFDFEAFGIIPQKHFAEVIERTKVQGNEMEGYLMEIHTELFGRNRPTESEIPILIDVIDETIKKLKEIEAFYNNEEGERFLGAVLNKTKLREELEENFEQRIKQAKKTEEGSYIYFNEFGMHDKKTEEEFKNMKLDESWYDAHELTRGLVLQVFRASNILLKHLTSMREFVASTKNLDPVVIVKYDQLIAELGEFCKKGMEE